MFGGNTANIKAVITAEDRASRTLKGFGDNVDGLSGRLKAGLFAAGAAAVAFGVTSVKAFSESQNLIAQTNAVLKSTGGIAGVTAAQVTKLAIAWEHQSKFSDEAVRNAENILLTFTSINKDIFPQTTQAVLDIATALHEDLQSASIQVGKALQDPILGVTALRRVGVNFSVAQRDMIKNLVETGHKAQAQAMILKELQVEFGGSAKAAGQTFAGQLTILKNRFNDVQEIIGQFIVNALFRLIAVISSVSGSVQSIVGVLNKFFGPSLQALFNIVATQLLPSLTRLWNTLQPGLTQTLRVLAIIIGGIIVASLWIFINVLNISARVISNLISFVSQLLAWLGNLGGVGINAARAIASGFSGLLGVVRAVIDAVQFLINLAGRAAGIVSHLNPVTGAKSLLSHLPHFAEGGVVPGAMGQPTLAVVHGGETVIPAGKGGASINININAGAFMGSQIEARKYAKLILDAMQDMAGSKNTTVAKMMGA